MKKPFESPDESLEALLKEIDTGRIQLPEFQRRWIWDDDHIRSLLASVSRFYPIGAIMLLQTGNEDVRFLNTPVAGAPPPRNEPERLILDGQQRLTSLYQALFGENPVDTRDSRRKQIKRYYYIDMAKALDDGVDREEAFIATDERKRWRQPGPSNVFVDLGTPEAEYQRALFPANQVLDSGDWRQGFEKFWGYAEHRVKQFNEFDREVLRAFERFEIPAIVLKRDTPKEAVCQVFEKVNTGGVPLNVFELLTATFAVDGFSLKDDWDEKHARLSKHDTLKRIENTDVLQGVALLATREARLARQAAGTPVEQLPGISCKKKEVLGLTLEDYRRWSGKICDALVDAAELLHSERIFSSKYLPYRSQLVPLSAIMAVLGVRAGIDGVRKRLMQWYWCGVFSELYGGSIESRFARDLGEVLAWIDGGSEPSTVSEAVFNPKRLYSLRSRLSAAYRGVHALLLKDGALDFKSGQPIDSTIHFQRKIDIHHIFPADWCRKNKSTLPYDCIVNKTPLSARTNRIVGSNAPSVYLPKLQKDCEITGQRMDEILISHVIEPALLRSDNMDEFFRLREAAILGRIAKAMGKPVGTGELDAEPSDFDDPADLDEAEYEDDEDVA